MTLKNNRVHLLYYVKLCAMGELKLELLSENAQFGSKSMIFFVLWNWNLMITLKNNRTPLQCYFKFCASFCSYWWIQNGVRVQKGIICVKIDDLFSHVTLKFDRWPWKTIGHLSKATSSFVHHFIIIHEFKLALRLKWLGLGLGLQGLYSATQYVWITF